MKCISESNDQLAQDNPNICFASFQVHYVDIIRGYWRRHCYEHVKSSVQSLATLHKMRVTVMENVVLALVKTDIAASLYLNTCYTLIPAFCHTCTQLH